MIKTIEGGKVPNRYTTGAIAWPMPDEQDIPVRSSRYQNCSIPYASEGLLLGGTSLNVTMKNRIISLQNLFFSMKFITHTILKIDDKPVYMNVVGKVPNLTEVRNLNATG